MELSEVKERFIEIYGNNGRELHAFHAPGRVNLIGEHTDYNGGNVFPCALGVGTYAVARRGDDRKVRLASTSFDLQVELSLDSIAYDKADDWANYPKGVISAFMQNRYNPGGFEVLFAGNIPNGAGLSSSASIELATAVMLKGLFNLPISMLEMVKLGQWAENSFVGLNCGIMDQFAVGFGRRSHALFLNCTTLDYELVPMELGEYRLVVANTNKRRGLTDSKYNERRAECESALADLRKELKINSLSALTPGSFDKHRALIKSETEARRAEHVIYENDRVLQAVAALKVGKLERFGQLMNESHRSLRDLYEVTGSELDTLVEEAWNSPGVLGSRMTGAGFGGCTVSIVNKEQVEQFCRQVGEGYRKRSGLEATFYLVKIGNGAEELELS